MPIDQVKNDEYDPHAAMSEKLLLKKLEISRESAQRGKFKDADSIIDEMREKFKL